MRMKIAEVGVLLNCTENSLNIHKIKMNPYMVDRGNGFAISVGVDIWETAFIPKN